MIVGLFPGILTSTQKKPEKFIKSVKLQTQFTIIPTHEEEKAREGPTKIHLVWPPSPFLIEKKLSPCVTLSTFITHFTKFSQFSY